MSTSEILSLRLHNQLLSSTSPQTPEAIVSWMGAMQAQDFAAAKWGIGLRSQNLTDQDIEDAFNQGKILRTHVMRPTWHFVSPKDIRWMLALTKARVHKLNMYYYKRLGLDTSLLKKCLDILQQQLAHHTYLTREEIANKLNKNFLMTKDRNLTIALILMYAELEGIICSGPRKGKQFTYALLDERVPDIKETSYDASLAELATRYFQSHGPATLQDFVWWSGITTLDAKKAIEFIKSKLNQEIIGNVTYWSMHTTINPTTDPAIYLLPNYDEYIIGYKDRSFMFEDKNTPKLDARANPLFQHTIILDGNVIGTWKRELKKGTITLATNLFEPLPKTEEILLQQAIRRLELFANKTIS